VEAGEEINVNGVIGVTGMTMRVED